MAEEGPGMEIHCARDDPIRTAASLLSNRSPQSTSSPPSPLDLAEISNTVVAGSVVASHNPALDISPLLQERIIQQTRAWDEPNTSPLTSLASSPATTPPSSPSSFPTFIPNLPLIPSLTIAPPPVDSQQPEPLTLPSDSPSTSDSALTANKRDRKAKRKAAHTAARKKTRARQANESFGLYAVRQRVLDRYAHDGPAITTSFATEASKVDSKGFVGLRGRRRPKKIYSLDELVGEGSRWNFRLIKWDGKTPAPITDSNNRLIGVLAGTPPDVDWPARQREAAQALEEHRRRCVPHKDKKKRNNRRGPFMALQCGVSHGGGQTAPKNLYNMPENQKIVEELNEMEPFKRIAGFASSVLACRAPLMYNHYARTLGQLFESDKSLKKIFPSTIFPAATYNLGPNTVCYPHLDFGNYACGMCAVTPVGVYDYTKGGHLVLWDCHLVIQFPPGSTILLPSAIVAHSNTAIQPHETRYLFALYGAGALFRWVENGFQRSSDFYASLSAEEYEATEVANEARWRFGLSLLPVLKK